MRSEKALKNIIVSAVSFLLLFVVGLVIRKLLLESFDTELVGYEGLISDIFGYIALIDIGMDSLFSYRLYGAIANDDKEKINKYVSMYRFSAICVGGLTLIASIVVYLMIPFIFSQKVTFWKEFNLIFLMTLIYTTVSYLFDYRRKLLVCSQLEYKAIYVETAIKFLSIILKIAVLLTSKGYILYMFLSMICNILNYLLVYYVSKKEFPDITYKKVTIEDFKEEKMGKECKEIIGIKISSTIMWSSTNLLTALLIDVSTSSLYYNYSIIASSLWNFCVSVVKTMTASIADMLYKDEKEESYKFYEMVSLAMFFLACVVLTGYLTTFQSLISTLFGKQYLLDEKFLVAHAFLYYAYCRCDSIGCFRDCLGDFNIESKYTILGSVLYILVAIILSPILGMSGIILGYIISIICLFISRVIIVEKNFFNKNIINKFIKEVKYLLLATLECFVAYKLVNIYEANFINIFKCTLISLIVPTFINILVFYKTVTFKNLINYIKSIVINIFRGGK